MSLVSYPDDWIELVVSLNNLDNWVSLSPAWRMLAEESYERVTGDKPDEGLMQWLQATVKEAMPDYSLDGRISMDGVGLFLNDDEQVEFRAFASGQRAHAKARVVQVLASGGIRKCGACSNMFVGSRNKKYCSADCHEKVVTTKQSKKVATKLSPAMLDTLEGISEGDLDIGETHGTTISGLVRRGLVQWVVGEDRYSEGAELGLTEKGREILAGASSQDEA